MFFHLVMSVGQRKNSESPWGIQPQTDFGFGFVLLGTQNFSFVPRSWQDEKTSFLLLYRAQNLPSLLFLFKINDILIIYPSICLFIHPFYSLSHSLSHSFGHSLYGCTSSWMFERGHAFFFLIQKLHKIFWKWWKSAPTDLKERSVPLPTWRQDKWWFKVIC